MCLPLIDLYYLIPSSAQSLNFAADQITSENQGVEVAGFAVWKIEDPQKASSNFDFSNSTSALASIGESLCNVVEFAIRHQVANMTIDDVLRKRGSIILQLKKELAYMAGQWGLLIETVEIRNVKVLSAQLFKQMQAPFETRCGWKVKLALWKPSNGLLRSAWRTKSKSRSRSKNLRGENWNGKSEAERLKISVEADLQATRLDHQRELVAREEELHKVQAILATERQRHVAALAVIDDETQRRQISTSNLEDRALALVRQIPAALGALKVNELNLGDTALQSLVRDLGRALGNSSATKDG